MRDKKMALESLRPPSPLELVIQYLTLKRLFNVTQTEFSEAAGIARQTFGRYVSEYKDEAEGILQEGKLNE
ncbi:hypothetical protein [Vagococcus fluvialis]|uniref:hypothetical protein n=1 Tax=Vagococcus fluvialis TaxID=2738 RepID=UPI003B2203AF